LQRPFELKYFFRACSPGVPVVTDTYTLGFEVISLKRVQHGTITLEGLKKGQIKAMKPKHVKELKGYLAKIRREQKKEANA
jgi:hypothetical protein